MVIAGLGANREEVGQELLKLVEDHQLPIATTYMAKGIVSENHPNSFGIIGFLVEDYIERLLEDYDLIITVGFDFSELDPDRLNPEQDKKIIHIHSYEQDTHKKYSIDSNLIGKLDETLTKFTGALADFKGPEITNDIQPKLREQLEKGAESSEDGPLTPVQIIHATKEVLSDEDQVFVDTGALKMWMARLYPSVNLNQVKVNNAMSSMAWTIPGTIAAKLINPEQRILTMSGDGSFNMNSQELALAKKLGIPMTIVIWDDSGYELIKWKMEMTIDESAGVEFKNPDFVKIAEAYGGSGYVANNRDHYAELLRECFEKQEGINIIVAPVDYSKNYDLSDYLAELE